MSPGRLTADEQHRVDEIEGRLASHLVDVEEAHAEGKLWDLVRDTPPVEEQIRGSNASAE